MPPSMEGRLIGLGLPIKLHEGVIQMINDKVICEKGKAITSNESKILKIWKVELANFKMHLISKWNKEDGYFSYGYKNNDNKDNEEDNDEEENENNIEEDE
jgi:mRNA turnover protein 4